MLHTSKLSESPELKAGTTTQPPAHITHSQKMSYYSLEDILSEQTKLKCKFKTKINMPFLKEDGEIPFWLASELGMLSSLSECGACRCRAAGLFEEYSQRRGYWFLFRFLGLIQVIPITNQGVRD
jgi:hypothetical protein